MTICRICKERDDTILAYKEWYNWQENLCSKECSDAANKRGERK